MNKISTYWAILVGGVCGYFLIKSFVLGNFFTSSRTVPTDVLQGFLIGFGLAYVTAQIYARIKARKVNGWITMFGLGEPGNGMFLRAAHAQLFPGPVNVPQEVMYWWTNSDGAGHALSGAHGYVMHFPAGGLPPNQAFWSLTMGMREITLWRIRSTGTASATGPDSRKTQTVRSIFSFRMPPPQAMNPTGCPPLRASSSCGCACTYGEAILHGEYMVPPVGEVR